MMSWVLVLKFEKFIPDDASLSGLLASSNSKTASYNKTMNSIQPIMQKHTRMETQ